MSTASDFAVGDTVTSVGSTGVTITWHGAVFPPVFVLTVMTAVPTAFAVTSPALDTVATAVLLLFQVTLLSVALLGNTVAVS